MSVGYWSLKNLCEKHLLQHMLHFSSFTPISPYSLQNIPSVQILIRPWKIIIFFFQIQTVQMKVHSVKSECFMALIMRNRNFISRIKKITFILTSVQVNIYSFWVNLKRFEVPEIRFIFKNITFRNQDFASVKNA